MPAIPNAVGNSSRFAFYLGGVARRVHRFSAMSLRARIVAAIVLVLILGSGLGLALAGWQARQWLRAELTSAQMSGSLAVTRAYADLPRAAQAGAALEQLIATFNGNRHLQ